MRRVTEFHNPEIEALQDKIAEENGYRIVDHALYMYGVCGECQTKNQTLISLYIDFSDGLGHFQLEAV